MLLIFRVSNLSRPERCHVTWGREASSGRDYKSKGQFKAFKQNNQSNQRRELQALKTSQIKGGNSSPQTTIKEKRLHKPFNTIRGLTTPYNHNFGITQIRILFTQIRLSYIHFYKVNKFYRVLTNFYRTSINSYVLAWIQCHFIGFHYDSI